MTERKQTDRQLASTEATSAISTIECGTLPALAHLVTGMKTRSQTSIIEKVIEEENAMKGKIILEGIYCQETAEYSVKM